MKTNHIPAGRQRPHFIITGYTRRRGRRGDGKLVEQPNFTESEE
jgi:hypothetical protein